MVGHISKIVHGWIESLRASGLTFGPAGKDIEVLLICDNLDGQTCEEFRRKIKELDGIVRYGPSGKTDAWQPVDSDIGRLVKVLISNEQQEWLEHDESMDLCLGNNEEKLTTKQRRILIMHLAGKTFEKLKH